MTGSLGGILYFSLYLTFFKKLFFSLSHPTARGDSGQTQKQFSLIIQISETKEDEEEEEVQRVPNGVRNRVFLEGIESSTATQRRHAASG
jgi:hypothetical protein